MLVSNNCLNMITEFEGFSERAYWDGDGYSIGYGHHGNDVQSDDYVTPEHAYKLLIDDVLRFEKHVGEYDYIYHWTQNEFDALVSFAYNIGSIDQLTQDGTRTKKEIAEHMVNYIYFEDKPNEGLRRRRQAEHDLFINEDSTPVNCTTFNEYTEDTTIKTIVDDILLDKFGKDEVRKNNIYELIQSFVNKRYE